MKYDIFAFDEIKKRVPNTQLIKERKKWYGEQDHTRWVYLDTQNGQCIKMWNETYVRRDGVLRGLENGFYDKNLIPAFQGLILDENKTCRGYIMDICKPIRIESAFWEQIFSYVKNKTKQTGFFAYDFLPEHIMFCEKLGKYTLIDLEGVYHITEYKDKLDDHTNYLLQQKESFMKNKVYEGYVIELLRSN